MTLHILVDATVYAPKHLDEVGRCECCKRKPLVYKRTRDPRYPRGHFCSRCDRAYSLETGTQIENWAFPRGKWATIQEIERQLHECADQIAASLE